MSSLLCDSGILAVKWRYYVPHYFVLRLKLVTIYKAFRTVPGAYLVFLTLTIIIIIIIIAVMIFEQNGAILQWSRVEGETMWRGDYRSFK